MQQSMCGRVSRWVTGVPLTVLLAAVPATAAETTLTLSAPDTQVTDTVIRGGSYASRNFDRQALETRASESADYTRYALLKFDTSTTVPAGSRVQSATLTLTVSGGNRATRRLGAFAVTESFQEHQATWKIRKSGYRWTTQGGTVGPRYATATVTAKAGSTVTFDVTGLVQDFVSGKYSSRYARVAIRDLGGAARDSYRTYHPSESRDPSVRPTLVVTWTRSSSSGSKAPAARPSPKPSSESPARDEPRSGGHTLRVLHWNTHHGGVGTDGRRDPDRLVKWIASFDADVISLNEVDTASQADGIISRLNARTGRRWKSAFSGWGNLLLTRLPLDGQSVCHFNRDAGRKGAHLTTIVNGRPLNIWSVHLAVDSSRTRVQEVKAVQGCADDWPEARIVAGDFNMQASSTEYAVMARTYIDGWKAAKARGATTNYPGNKDGATRRSRIDYVFGSKGATFLAVQAAQIYDTRDANGVMPSDHKPMVVTYTVK